MGTAFRQQRARARSAREREGGREEEKCFDKRAPPDRAKDRNRAKIPSRRHVVPPKEGPSYPGRPRFVPRAPTGRHGELLDSVWGGTAGHQLAGSTTSVGACAGLAHGCRKRVYPAGTLTYARQIVVYVTFSFCFYLLFMTWLVRLTHQLRSSFSLRTMRFRHIGWHECRYDLLQMPDDGKVSLALILAHLTVGQLVLDIS